MGPYFLLIVHTDLFYLYMASQSWLASHPEHANASAVIKAVKAAETLLYGDGSTTT